MTADRGVPLWTWDNGVALGHVPALTSRNIGLDLALFIVRYMVLAQAVPKNPHETRPFIFRNRSAAAAYVLGR